MGGLLRGSCSFLLLLLIGGSGGSFFISGFLRCSLLLRLLLGSGSRCLFCGGFFFGFSFGFHLHLLLLIGFLLCLELGSLLFLCFLLFGSFLFNFLLFLGFLREFIRLGLSGVNCCLLCFLISKFGGQRISLFFLLLSFCRLGGSLFLLFRGFLCSKFGVILLGLFLELSFCLLLRCGCDRFGWINDFRGSDGQDRALGDRRGRCNRGDFWFRCRRDRCDRDSFRLYLRFDNFFFNGWCDIFDFLRTVSAFADGLFDGLLLAVATFSAGLDMDLLFLDLAIVALA